MCFVLYVGTFKPLPKKEWREDAPDISVQAPSERERPICIQFSTPHVHYIGSTSECGCDFPHVTLQNGGWPWFEDDDPERQATDRYNRQALVKLLRATDEQVVELYGVWDGDFETLPAVREEIALETILDPAFRFKERGFYLVRLT